MEYLNLPVQLNTFLFNLLTVSKPGSGSIKDRTGLSLVPKYLSQCLKPLRGMLMGLGLPGAKAWSTGSPGVGAPSSSPCLSTPSPLTCLSGDGLADFLIWGGIYPHVRFEIS